MRWDLEFYLDGELASDRTRELEGHVRACPECAAEVLRSVQWKRQVKAAGAMYSPSAEFRGAMTRRLQKAPKKAWRWNWALAGAWRAPAPAVFGFSMVRRSQERLVAEHTLSEVADLHVATLASASPVDVVSTDRHTVKPWFHVGYLSHSIFRSWADSQSARGRADGVLAASPGRRTDFPDPQASDFGVHIPGACAQRRIGFLNGQSHQLTFNMNTWTQNGLRYVVVGDASGSDIASLSQLLKAAS